LIFIATLETLSFVAGHNTQGRDADKEWCT